MSTKFDDLWDSLPEIPTEAADFDALWDAPPKRGVLERAGRLFDRATSMVGQRLGNTAAGVLDLVGADTGAERVRGLIGQERERLGPAETGLETATDIGGAIFGEGAQFLAPGAALSKIPKVANLGRGGRIAAGLAADIPVDVAIGAGDAETSTAGVLADITGNERLRSISESPIQRGGFEALTGLAAGGLLTGAAAGARAGARRAGKALDVTPTIDSALDEAFGPDVARVGQPNLAEGIRPRTEPLDPMSAAAAALRRADAEAKAAREAEEAAVRARAESLRGAPPPEDPRIVRGTPRDPEAEMLVQSRPSGEEPLIVPAGHRPLSPRTRPATPAEVQEFAPEPLPLDRRARHTPEELEREVRRLLIREQIEPDFDAGGFPRPSTIQGPGYGRSGPPPAPNSPPGVRPAPDPNVSRGTPASPQAAIRDESVEEAIEDAVLPNVERVPVDVSDEVASAMEFQKDYGYEVPVSVGDWDYSTTFGRWGAVVEFADGTRTFTYPRDRNFTPPGVETTAQRKESLLGILRQHVAGMGEKWEGAELGKALVGNSVIAAARSAGATDTEIRAALGAVTPDAPRGKPRGKKGLKGNRPGFVETATAKALGRGVTGAAIGAPVGTMFTDEENDTKGAIGGALTGAALAVAPSLLRGGKRALSEPDYLKSPAVQSVLRTVSKGAEKPSFLQRMGKVGDVAGEAGRKLYTRLVDDVQPLRSFGREVGGSERLSQVVSQAKGHRGGATQRLNTEFRAVVQAAKGNEAGVTALAKAERALELAANGMPEKGVDLDAARQTVDELSNVPEVRQAVDALRTYYRKLLDFKLENGVITREQYDAITSKGEYYVPFVRDFGQDVPPSAGGGRLVNRGTGVRKMSKEAATAQTVDPFEQAILDTFEAHRTVAKQRVSNVVASIVEADPEAAAPFIRKIADPKDAKLGRAVQANIGGKRQAYEVIDKELFDAWASFDNRTRTIFERALSPFKRTLQAGVTLMPDFAAANAIRDNVQSAIQYGLPWKQSLSGAGIGAGVGAAVSEDRGAGALTGAGIGLGVGGITPQIARSLGAMRDIIKNDEVYQQWLREGGSGFSEFYGRPEEARKLIREFLGDRSIKDTILRPVDGLRAIGRAAEEAPRLARFKAMRAQGADITEAIASSRDVSLDFANIGKDTKGIASVTAFFNAKVQGWDKLARLLKNPKTWAVGAASITAPSIALWNVNKDDAEYWARPQWERNLFWLVPRPEGGFYRIPKPFEIGFIFGSLPERILDFAYQNDPETLTESLKDMLFTTFEGTVPFPTGLEPHAENLTNFDFFTRRPVVSMGLERLPEELQYDNRTSSAAIGLEKVIPGKQSPQKIDNVLRGYTGSAGQLALQGIDKLARATGLDRRPEQPQGRTPLVGRFVTRDDQTSDQEIALRRRIEKAEKAWAGFRELVDRGDMEKARKFAQENRDILLQREQLATQRRMLDRVSKLRRQVYDADVPAEQKREALVKINTAMARLLGRGEAQAQMR